MKMKHTCLLLTAALLASCGKPETTAEAGASPPGDALSAVLQATPAGDPQAIHLVRDAASPGDRVTVGGRVMGSLNPFVDGRAAFILGDPEVLTPCNEKPGDSCATPWDVCCDTAEDKRRGTATIQVLGGDGRVLREAIEGVGGIDKLATLTVSGTVAEGSAPGALVINAHAIDVMK